MRVLIAGASGFIGKNILLNKPQDWEVDAQHRNEGFCNFLDENNIGAEAVRCDLSDRASVSKALGGKEYDLVIYLAGNSDPQISFSDPLLDAKSNVLSIINFLETIRCGRLVFFSSGAVYDGLRGSVSPDSKIDPKLPYAISKYASEQYIKFFSEKKGSVGEYAIIRFFGAFGPHEPQRKIFTKLVRNFAIERKNSFGIYGDGENLIDAMYVDDAVEAVRLIASSSRSNYTADLTGRDPISINKLVERAARAFGIKNLEINHSGVSHEPIGFRSADRTLEKMGFSPKTNLEEGLKKLAEFQMRSSL